VTEVVKTIPRERVGTHAVELPPIPPLAGKRLLALDLGRLTGWALETPSISDSGTHTLFDIKGKVRTYEDGERFSAFEDFLDLMWQRSNGLDIVAFEEVHPRTHASSRQIQLYEGFRAVLMSFCRRRKTCIVPIPVATVKRICSGNGRAKKADMIAAVCSLGYAPWDDNEADAIAIMLTLLLMPEMTSPKIKPAQSDDRTRKRRTPHARRKRNTDPIPDHPPL
jgi:Holliday junction resolvasome RuvABC endonuclease subunit